MKKNAIYALMSAIALTGALSFSSCSSVEDDNVNPGYNSDTGEVPVQFMFNVASSSGQSSTRQTAEATQASDNITTELFRGIEGAHVMCFKQGTDNNGSFVATPQQAAKDFNMARVANANTLGSNGSTRVLEMSLPLKVNSMVFYGRAIVQDANEDDRNKYGHLDEYNISEDLYDVSFHLSKRLDDTEKKQFEQVQKLFADVLTCIMETDRGTGTARAIDEPDEGCDPYGFDILETTAPNLHWRQYQLGDGAKSPVDNATPLTQLESKLAKAYKEMTTIRDAELRNGSGPAILSTIEALWTLVNGVRCAQPTDLCEAVAKYMAQRIHEEISKYFQGLAPTSGGPVTGVSMKSATAMIDALVVDTYWPSTTKPISDNFYKISNFTSTNLAIFPAQYDLPQGSTHYKFNNGSGTGVPTDVDLYCFYYVQNYNSSAAGGTPFTVDDYYYPAELLYFGNGPIRVSDAEHLVSQYPQTTTAWNVDNWEGWTKNGEVSSSTRSVALQNDINYGTALLQTKVGYATDISNSNPLEDNNKTIQQRDYQVSENNNTIVPNETSFKLVGILVGGQSPRVGWNYLPKLNPEVAADPEHEIEYKPAERQGYIYDKVMKVVTEGGVEKIKPGDIPTSRLSDPIYTLVFDNYNQAADEGNQPQDKVYIALEFQNNTGVDFFGVNNLIANGSNFYLIGELDPTHATNAPAAPEYHALPPYTDNKNLKSVPRVFMQDHKTEVSFRIGKYSLQYAYLTVPDLRSSSVTLGLSVDMKWSTGLKFEDVVVGGNTQTTTTPPSSGN